MSVVSVEKPTFSNESIRAMGPIAQEIAALLLEAGYIRIVDQFPAITHKEDTHNVSSRARK